MVVVGVKLHAFKLNKQKYTFKIFTQPIITK